MENVGDFGLGEGYPYLERPSWAREGFLVKVVSLELEVPQVSGKSRGKRRIQSDFSRLLKILHQFTSEERRWASVQHRGLDYKNPEHVAQIPLVTS